MGSQRNSSIILGSVALALTSSWATADEKNDDNTIIVTANRVEQNVNDVLAVTEVISREDIERLQPESITDLLTTIAGLNLAHNGGAGQVSSLFTRGTESDHTLIIIDGIRVGSATSGRKALASIPVAQIERIEIVKGPRATLWGSDAIGGVIQIFTRKLKAGESAASLTLGSHDYSSSSFSLGMGNENFSNTISVSNDRSEGYDVFNNSIEIDQDDDGYSRTSVAIRGDYYVNDNQNLDWVLQRDQGDVEFDNSNRANTNYDNYFWSLRYRFSLDDLLVEASLAQSIDDSTTSSTTDSDLEDTIFSTKRDQVNLLVQYKVSEFFTMLTGLEKYNDDVADSLASYTDYITREELILPYDAIERNVESAFATSLFNYNNIIAAVSIRHDDIGGVRSSSEDSLGSSQTFNVSLGYKLSNNMSISANRSKGFKMPTFDELYYPTFANPNLRPEVSYNNEIIFKANWNNQSITLAAYDNKIINSILSSGRMPINTPLSEINGYEAIYHYNRGFFSHKLSLAYIDAENSNTKKQLIRRAKKNANYEVTFDYESLSFFTQVNYSGKRNDTDFSDYPNIRAVILDSFVQTNLGFAYTANDNWKYTFKVNDVGNASPVTALDFNAPGRQLFLGFQYNNFND